MFKIRVLIVDDHAILREGIRAMLSYHEDILVVGEAQDGAEAVERTGELQPDVVLMDIAMQRMNGLDATRLICTQYPQTHVLVLSQHEDRQYVLPLLQAGASGYLLKRALGNDLITALHTIARGETYLDPGVGGILVDEIRSRNHPAQGSPAELTPREKEVLRLLAEGLSNSQIAGQIHYSENTVKKHIRSILEKLHMNNRIEAAVYAIKTGLVN